MSKSTWGRRMAAREEAAQRAGPTAKTSQTQKAIDLCAQLKRVEAEQARIKAEQVAARKRSEQLAEMLEQIKRIEATAKRQRMARARGNYIY